MKKEKGYVQRKKNKVKQVIEKNCCGGSCFFSTENTEMKLKLQSRLCINAHRRPLPVYLLKICNDQPWHC